MWHLSAALGAAAGIAAVASAGSVQISEIRIDQPSTDNDEYFELAGPSGTSLTGMTLIVIGDGSTGSGTIEAVVSLAGQSIPASGYFLAAEATFSLGGTVNLTTDLNFENGDNVTFVLVTGFTGASGDDLDTNDDGVLDSTPWTSVVDAIGLIEEDQPPTSGSEYAYGAALGFEDLGPDDVFVPGHAFRCQPENTWAIGLFDPADMMANDTPGAMNGACPIPPAIDLDVFKDGTDFVNAGGNVTYTIEVTNDGVDPAPNVTITDTLPAGFGFVSETSPANVMLTGSTPPTITWTMTSLGAGETVVITLVASTSGTGEFINNATATTSGTDVDPANNTWDHTVTVSPVGVAPAELRINEIRVAQPGADLDEFFELKGTPGASLDGIFYVVIGDGDPLLGSGIVEEVIPLSGLSMQGNGLFLCAEMTFTLAPPFTVNLLLGGLQFEDSDNVTHLLALGFQGSFGDDLDTDDDGSLDVLPWTSVIDAVGIIEENQPPMVESEYSYGIDLGFSEVGPDGTFLPGHVWRCEPDRTWQIGAFDPLDAAAVDSPAQPNPDCPTCPGDTNGDLIVDVSDLVNVILDWGTDGSGHGGDLAGASANDGSPNGIVDVADLVTVILNWGNVCG